MGMNKGKAFIFTVLGTAIGLSGFAGQGHCAGRAGQGPAGAPQVFRATEDDGTAEVVRTGKPVDESGTDSDLAEYAPPAPKKKAPAAPVVSKATVTADADDVDASNLKRENAILKKRLETLEQAKAEKQKAATTQAEVDPAQAAADAAAAEQAADAANTAPGADLEAAKAPTNGETVEGDAATPTDTVEGRLKEKARITREARTELAKEEHVEQKKKDLKEMSSRFDKVPDQRIAELAQRLRYANDILKRWGRAYDYRVTTLKDFQKIVAELEAADEKTSAVN